MPQHWRPPRVRLRRTCRGRIRTWGVRVGGRLVWLRREPEECERVRGSGVSELRKESIVEIARVAMGQTYNFGHMHVPDHVLEHRVEARGTHKPLKYGLKRIAFLELAAGCSAQVACKEKDVELRRPCACETVLLQPPAL